MTVAPAGASSVRALLGETISKGIVPYTGIDESVETAPKPLVNCVNGSRTLSKLSVCEILIHHGTFCWLLFFVVSTGGSLELHT